MSCDLEYFVVHSYFDGELSVIRAAEFKHHLADCSDCMNELAALGSVRGSLKHARLYETAPASLRRKIRADLHSIMPTTRRSLILSGRGLAAATGLVLVSSFGTRVNRTVLRVQVRGKATNGLIGEKTSWSSVPSPMLLLLTWSDSSGS